MSEIKTVENLDQAEEYFSEAYDRLNASRSVCANIIKMAEDCLAYARPTLELIQLGRIKVDGETKNHIEIGIAMVSADQSHAKESLDNSEKKAIECASILRRLEMYLTTNASDKELIKWSTEFSKSLWFLTSSADEVQVLHGQTEGSVANLAKLLPL
jgi:hypothetical protein